jgi:hypothetical protein
MQTLQNGIQQVGKTFSNLFGISKSKDGNRLVRKKSKKRTIRRKNKSFLDGMNHYDDDDDNDNSKGKIKRRSRRGRRNRKSRRKS